MLCDGAWSGVTHKCHEWGIVNGAHGGYGCIEPPLGEMAGHFDWFALGILVGIMISFAVMCSIWPGRDTVD